MLVESGAEEFYVGYIPMQWLRHFTAGVWMNRRSPQASIPTIEEYAQLVGQAHSYGVPVFMTLNAPYYTADQLPLLLEIAKEAHSCGTDAFIISDIALMIALKERIPDATIHVSSLATPTNSQSIRLYQELGASRIIFPRSLSLEEMKEVIDAGGRDLEYEVFILNDGCVYEEGFCFTTHNQVGAFCASSNWDFRFMSATGKKELSSREKEALQRHLNDYHEFVWFTHSCGCSVSDQGIPLGPCGLCSLPKIRDMGIDSLKIVGREAHPLRKLVSVQLVSAVVRAIRNGMDEAEVQKKARQLRNTPEFCHSGYMCYYR